MFDDILGKEAEPTPQTGKGTEDWSRGIESTAKALEGVDKKNLPKVKVSNEDVIALRNAKTKEQIDAALLQASQEQSISMALDNLGFLVSGIKEKYYNKDYSWLEDLANEIEKISKGTTTDVKSISEAYHKAKADGSNPELVAAVEELLNDNRTTNEANQPVPLNKGNEPIRYEDAIKITPTSILTNPEQYGVDELGIEAKSAAIRNEEKTPPKFVKYKIGTYAKDKFGDLYQLQRVPIDKIVLPEGETKRQEIVDKYKKWEKEGSTPPPAKGVENFAVYGGKVVINDGHHRVIAAKQLGKNSVDVWVSLTDPNNPSRPIQDIDYHKSIQSESATTKTNQPVQQDTPTGKELAADALDRIASKLGGKKNLTEEGRTSLAKDVTDLAKGLIQMGKATLGNVIDKIKDEIRKRLPDIDDKTLND